MNILQELESELKAMNFESEDELCDYVGGGTGYPYWKYDKLKGVDSGAKAKHLWNKWQEEKQNGNTEQLPTLEEVKERYKNVKFVRCLYSNSLFDISDKMVLNEFKTAFRFTNEFLDDEHCWIWDSEDGWAEIIEYKEEWTPQPHEEVEVSRDGLEWICNRLFVGKTKIGRYVCESKTTENIYTYDHIRKPINSVRRFKHKQTGIIGENNPDSDFFLHFKRGSGNVVANESISMCLVENSNDWIELYNDHKQMKIPIKQQAEILYQTFGGSKDYALKCVRQIIKATRQEVWSCGGGAFVGSVAKKKYSLDPYWVAVEKYIKKNY